ncbi:MAG TPA: CHAT domain-containing tetratricopeptide repeat protein [Bacteroidales bacterium]|nr:CHAT domain-containing tetratricopeptide repeat protein [Bacteroidales bacterium]
MKRFIFIVLLLLPALHPALSLQPNDIRRDIERLRFEFDDHFKSGDFHSAERTAFSYFNYPLTDYLKGVAYSELISVYMALSRFDEALAYARRIEKLELSKDEEMYLLPYTYLAEAMVFEKRRSYFQAIEYAEKAIRLYNSAGFHNRYFLLGLSSAYHNLGTYYNETGEFKKGLDYLRLSLKMKETYLLSDKAVTLTSIARSYVGLSDNNQAEKYFRNCIEIAVREQGKDYYRLAEFFFNLGEFLQAKGRMEEAKAQFRSGLNRCLKVYGEKHNQTSRAYAFLGGNSLLSGDIDSSLYYYQKSLMAISRGFTDPNTAINPPVDSAIVQVRLMENLKGKSLALEELSKKQQENEKLKTLNLSLETIMHALDLIDVIRNNYPSEEIMMYLSGNEKETYISAMRVALSIYRISGKELFPEQMYRIGLRSKAAVLRNQISGNNFLYSSGLPRSLQEKQVSLSGNIAGYKKLLMEETSLPVQEQDTSKINIWKDELFNLNREKEKLADSISGFAPPFSALSKITTPVSPVKIMEALGKDETIIDYFISNKYCEGKRKLYIFVVSDMAINLVENEVDSVFSTNAGYFSKSLNSTPASDYIKALHYYYVNLIRPVKDLVKTKRLIIVPDEEINLLPFDAFLSEAPVPGKNDFDGLRFLVNDYAFSHSYSASLLSKHITTSGRNSVYSFSPAYGGETGYDSLEGAVREIRNINSVMRGRAFTFEKATKTAFMNSMKDSVIFHLAMHSFSDSANSLYSYLLFNGTDTNDSSKLYNFEISLGKIISPMIVLSSCNSGSGNLYSGEGQLSLARSFILAGASSVVRTAWDVNDDSGSEIITGFYQYISEGKNKDRAMQLAKIDFIKKSSPALRDPYYWAAYEVVGDNGPVMKSNYNFVTFVTILILLSGAGFIYFLRRRRIFSEASR